MDKIKVTEISPEECLEYKGLIKRRVSLQLLYKHLANNSNKLLYEKIVTDLWQTEESLNNWWLKMGSKYQFTLSPKLQVDFETGNIMSDTTQQMDLF